MIHNPRLRRDGNFWTLTGCSCGWYPPIPDDMSYDPDDLWTIHVVASEGGKTGTQNRRYTEDVLRVRAVLVDGAGNVTRHYFDWNDQACVRQFAAASDKCLRSGGRSELEALPERPVSTVQSNRRDQS